MYTNITVEWYIILPRMILYYDITHLNHPESIVTLRFIFDVYFVCLRKLTRTCIQHYNIMQSIFIFLEILHAFPHSSFHTLLAPGNRDDFIVSIHLPFPKGHVGLPGGTSDKEPACQCKRLKRHEFNPWIEKIPWHGNPLQYSCLENPMDRGA